MCKTALFEVHATLIRVVSARDMHQKERMIYEQDSKKILTLSPRLKKEHFGKAMIPVSI